MGSITASTSSTTVPPTKVAGKGNPAAAAKASMPGDRLAVGSDAALSAWIHATHLQVDHASKDELKVIADSVLAKAQDPGVSTENRARLYAVAAAAHGRLSDMEDQTGNGRKAFQEISKAAGLAPQRSDCVLGYAQAVNEVVKRGSFTRGIAERVLGISSETEATRALGMLKAFPDDPQAQLYRIRFGRFVEDDATVADATSRLAGMAPANVAAAEKQFGFQP